MILVDTSVWIDHFRRGNDRLAAFLGDGEVLGHPFITGELACGSFRSWKEILTLLNELPQASVASPSEVLLFIERHRLMGRGLGYVDVHLLASARLDRAGLWTRDRRLADAARSMKVFADPR